MICKLHCDYQRKCQAPTRAIRIQGHPISYPILIMILESFDPDIGIPDIEPDVEPDIGILNMLISEYPILKLIIEPDIEPDIGILYMPISGFPILILLLIPISGI
jgi:hypothetical protein